MSNLAKLQREAWEYYKTWMSEKTICKALNKEITISLKGWDHITKGSKTRKRKLKDKLNRLQLLKDAKFIIKNSNKITTKIVNQETFITIENSISRPNKIKVVIKKDKRGNLTFHSVMKH